MTKTPSVSFTSSGFAELGGRRGSRAVRTMSEYSAWLWTVSIGRNVIISSFPAHRGLVRRRLQSAKGRQNKMPVKMEPLDAAG